jgi:hypothetical protein
MRRSKEIQKSALTNFRAKHSRDSEECINQFSDQKRRYPVSILNTVKFFEADFVLILYAGDTCVVCLAHLLIFVTLKREFSGT